MIMELMDGGDLTFILNLFPEVAMSEPQITRIIHEVIFIFFLHVNPLDSLRTELSPFQEICNFLLISSLICLDPSGY